MDLIYQKTLEIAIDVFFIVVVNGINLVGKSFTFGIDIATSLI